MLIKKKINIHFMEKKKINVQSNCRQWSPISSRETVPPNVLGNLPHSLSLSL